MGRRRRGKYNLPEPEGPVTVVRREEKKDGKYEYKLAKIDGKTDRALATAAKRSATASLFKWLVILIGVVFAIFKMGGGGIFEFLKGLGGSGG